MLNRIAGKIISLSYGITVCNEADELEKLLETLIPNISKNDEIIVLQDITKTDDNVVKVIEKYAHKIICKQNALNGDFATFKNNFFETATGDYLFQIDADEVPTLALLKNIKLFLFKNRRYDCIAVPRINTVEGLTDEYIRKWNWTIDENNYVNFPDFQQRIMKLNGKIKWKNKVHEVLSGYRRFKTLPSHNYNYCLLHAKKLKKQIKQNGDV